ncbi:MAG: hypothetical protein EOO71_04490 [Myxococcaceae bacterium]|nr:MAG: hypothetical protein EOO71_04490 [Myxococcaceae bacterium]
MALNADSLAKTGWKVDEFGDAQHWLPPEYSTTVQLADVNSDSRANLCGRNATGMVCAFDTGSGTFTGYRYFDNAEYRDHLGGASSAYGMTMLLSDISGDGHADVCGRSVSRMTRALSP